jgi:single-strand DNA-binding protein
MYNHITLIGNLGAPDSIRVGDTNGTAMARFSLATTRYFTSARGTESRTTWHNVVAFGPIAETVRNYASKGRRVLVEGWLDSHPFEGADGELRKDVRIVAEKFRFLDPRPAEDVDNNPIVDLGLPPEATVPAPAPPARAPAPAPQPPAPQGSWPTNQPNGVPKLRTVEADRELVLEAIDVPAPQAQGFRRFLRTRRA